jgi:uncharacterized protein YyaL (SSP411 family)
LVPWLRSVRTEVETSGEPFAGKFIAGKTSWHLCTGNACLSPVYSEEEAEKLIRKEIFVK